MKNAIIVFIKNPIKGHVKTRLASTIGDEKALFIYLELIKQTFSNIQFANADIFLFFSQFVDDGIVENDMPCYKLIQSGNDLGERMKFAFDEILLNRLYQKVLLIGTDCPGINSNILNSAFKKLTFNDIVIGPAFDGGYYLIGMVNPHHELFSDIEWSTSSVLNNTLKKCIKNKLSYHLLPTLNDIDEVDDLVHLGKQFKYDK